MRMIQKTEYDFLSSLLRRTGLSQCSVGLSPTLLVEELLDGGMGSLRFHHGEDTKEDRLLGRPILEGEFHDCDGTTVSFTVNVDEHGQLYELDFWKVDFSPTEKFPQPEDVQEVRRVQGD